MSDASEPGDPIARFQQALARAEQSEPDVPGAATLATADADGRPSARMVLIRGVDERGFAFYTNYESKKALDLAVNPHAALCVHWKSLGEQVRIAGQVTRVSTEESDAYFAGRPELSRFASLASHQSRPLANRGELEQRYDALRGQFEQGAPSRPVNWGGYRLLPERMEFWFRREHRLHHRVLYERHDDGWEISLLNP